MEKSASLAQLKARPTDWWSGGRGFDSRWFRQHSFVKNILKTLPMVILSLPLIQEGQLLVPGEIMANSLEDLVYPGKVLM